LAWRQSRIRLELEGSGCRPAHVVRESENTDDVVAFSERQVLGAHTPELSTGVREDGLEVGRLTTLYSAAELRGAFLTCNSRESRTMPRRGLVRRELRAARGPALTL
jgi:hypothetical protein